ncbi:lipoprotein [Streptomyces griseomycini]|uniref:DUF305 domain-containing protein n=1 Tax=Streptomyces griseomycini TaxID=66895 RepID=UPI001874EF4D|nr:DUF305 domain-containing protein [Streptomyces griseomycini]GGQ20818.1 lipoprotein [Streptomyces griseomycini]
MMRKRSLVRRSAAVAAAGAAALVLAACGGDGDGGPAVGHGGHDAAASPSASSTASAPASQERHNAADVAFAKGMIPHHRQAVEMADLAPDRARSAGVRKLAADIRKAQGPEIETLSGWLTSWGEEVPAEGAVDHSGHGTGDMGGMMTDEEMSELGKASGEAFDTAFMELMIKHHEGAVEMARTEQADGAFGPARKMAGEIIASQGAEIEQMNELLGRG